MPRKKTPPVTAADEMRFETAMERLEEIVERMESEALELDESLALFEEGVRLMRLTQGILDRSEARIHELLEDGDGFRLDPWDPE
ncbi:MAG: exodeoxyribonuclease VII small subunit [Gemmatimonadetes bacterium]|nr:exodeoxyribonuclease VII small subunit [Gemmatimonadota bacterium]